MDTDTIQVALGGGYNQVSDLGEKLLVVFASRNLSKGERNYIATKRQDLVVLWGVTKALQKDTHGVAFICTDHYALTSVFGRPDYGWLANGPVRVFVHYCS